MTQGNADPCFSPCVKKRVETGCCFVVLFGSLNVKYAHVTWSQMVESTGLPVQFWRYQSLGVKIPFSNMFSRKVEAENDKCVFRQGRIIDSSFYNMYRTVPKNVPHCLSLPSSHFCLLYNRYSKYECGRHPGSSRSANKKRLSIDFSGLVCKYCRTASNCYLATQVRKRSTAKNRKVLLYFFSFYFFCLFVFEALRTTTDLRGLGNSVEMLDTFQE